MAERGSRRQALGYPPMPGLLDEMKEQRTMNPRLLTEEEALKAPTSEFTSRSHSSQRIDARIERERFQQAKKELESNLTFKTR